MRKPSFLYILIFSCTLISCHSFQPPQYVSYDHFQVKKINFTHAEIALDLHYFNPNRTGFTLKYIDIDIYVNDAFLSHAQQTFQIPILKNAAFTVPLKLNIDLKSLLKNAIPSLLKNKTSIKITGKITISKGRFFKSFPIQYFTEQDLSLF